MSGKHVLSEGVRQVVATSCRRTAACFEMIQNHVALLSGNVHAVPTRSTATASDAAVIIRDICMRSCAGFLDALVVDPRLHVRGVSRFHQEDRLVPGRWLGLVLPKEHQRRGGAGHQGHQRHAARLRQLAQGRLGQSSPASRLCHQQNRIDARRRLDVFLHRPRHPPPSPSLAALPRPRRRRVAGALRAADARHGGDVWELLAAAQADRKANLYAGPATARCCGPRSCSAPPTLVSCARDGTVPYSARLNVSRFISWVHI